MCYLDYFENLVEQKEQKKQFKPVEGDNITTINVSDDQLYVGIGTDSGLIKIY